MFSAIGLRFIRPVGGDFRMLQRATLGSFGLADGILQHRSLTSAQARWKAGITIGFRIIPDPKINAAVSREKNRVLSDDVVVNPTRRSAEDETGKKNSAS